APAAVQGRAWHTRQVHPSRQQRQLGLRDGLEEFEMKIASIGAVAAVGAMAAALPYSGYLKAQTLNSPTFTAAQATAGRDGYATNCASCHGRNLDDGEFAPPLKGAEFRLRWGGKSLDALFIDITTRMPTAAPGTLADI